MNKIQNENHFFELCDWCIKKEPKLNPVIEQFGYPPFWHREANFSTLILTILEQQVSLASAKAAYDKLIDRGLPEEEVKKIKEIVINYPRVKDVHKIRSRYLGCSDIAIDLHLLVDAKMSVEEGHDIAEKVKHEYCQTNRYFCYNS